MRYPSIHEDELVGTEKRVKILLPRFRGRDRLVFLDVVTTGRQELTSQLDLLRRGGAAEQPLVRLLDLCIQIRERRGLQTLVDPVGLLTDKVAIEHKELLNRRRRRLALRAMVCRVREVMQYLTDHINQLEGDYLIGNQFSAADIYYAYISNVFGPQPHEVNPMPDGLRKSYELVPGMMDIDSSLIEFRDRIFEKHLQLPLTF